MSRIQWSEMTAVDKTIIAASPMFQGAAECPHRIVIRDLGDQYVVHTQIFDGVQKPYFHQGDYFVKKNDSAPVGHPPADALCKAWARFEERTRRTMQMPSLQDRLNRMQELAETIITLSLPDDEENCLEFIKGDPELQQAISDWEGLTGKDLWPCPKSTS